MNRTQSSPNSEPPFGRGDDRSRNGRVLHEKIWSRAPQSSLRMPGSRRMRARAAKRSGILCSKIRSHLWGNSENVDIRTDRQRTERRRRSPASRRNFSARGRAARPPTPMNTPRGVGSRIPAGELEARARLLLILRILLRKMLTGCSGRSARCGAGGTPPVFAAFGDKRQAKFPFLRIAIRAR